MKAWILGQFSTADAMLGAGRRLRELGYTDLDGYSPYPLHGMEEALGIPKSRIPLLVLGGGLTGAIGGYLMQWYLNAVVWPINVGGRPPHSPPSFIPITFELGILLGAFGAFFGLFLLLRLPRLHHPVFEAPEFRSASLDRYWLSVCPPIDAPLAERSQLEAQLKALGADLVSTVEGEA
jgi:hypothetical protein